jgi:hypothetical protein
VQKIAEAIDKILKDIPKQFRIGVLICFIGLGLFAGAIYVESHDAKGAAQAAEKQTK